MRALPSHVLSAARLEQTVEAEGQVRVVDVVLRQLLQQRILQGARAVGGWGVGGGWGGTLSHAVRPCGFYADGFTPAFKTLQGFDDSLMRWCCEAATRPCVTSSDG